MALLWMDGFDHYGTNNSGDASTRLAKVYTVSNSYSVLCDTGRYQTRTGAGAIYMACGKYGTTKITKAITPTLGTTHLICGFNIYTGNVYGSYIRIMSGGTVEANAVSILSNVLKCGPNTIQTLTGNTWYHMEIRIPITTSVSNKYELYLNGTTVFSSSSLSFAWTNILEIGTQDTNNNGGYHVALDDLYVMDDTGSTSNARIGTELYIPRIETTYPIDDVTNNFTASYTPITSTTYGFQDLASTGVTPGAILTALSTNLGLTSLSQTGSDNLHFKMNANGGVSDSKCLLFRTYQNGIVPSVTFSTIASTLSFWYRDTTTADSTTLSVTVNGTQTFLALTTSMQQYTITLDANKVNTVKINASTNTDRYILLDDFTVTYTSKNAAQALYRNAESSLYNQSTTNGNKLIGNIGNLNTINDVKAVGFMPLASESVSATTSSYKLIANNGGSDTEIGTTQSVTGVTTARGPQLFDINPLTSTAWTASDFNALKAGVINKT
jgi:hypothetical protein